METSDLSQDTFWQSSEAAVLVNPRDAQAVREAELIREWIPNQSVLTGHVLFRTSGSSGGGKWVALSKQALRISARAVNDFLSVTSEDRWLQTLPLFHVGGMGIVARAYEAGCVVIDLSMKWDAAKYHQALEEERITLTSMVPTQLADMLNLSLSSPTQLRAVLLGGGRLSDVLYEKAIELGWPVRETYGMTETASQVATTDAGKRELKILPCWDVKTADDSRIQISGEALLSSYLSIKNGSLLLTDPKEDAWLTTNDLGCVSGGCIQVKGRVDRCVKILGELVNLTDVENALDQVLKDINQACGSFAVIAQEDDRGSHRLILCVEDTIDLDDLLGVYHAACHPLHRIAKAVRIMNLPRTGIGKIHYSLLQERFESGNM